jgi:hypothetical protein
MASVLWSVLHERKAVRPGVSSLWPQGVSHGTELPSYWDLLSIGVAAPYVPPHVQQIHWDSPVQSTAGVLSVCRMSLSVYDTFIPGPVGLYADASFSPTTLSSASPC